MADTAMEANQRGDEVRARTLLVIEDEAQIRRAIRNALRETVDRVVEAATGSEGIDLAAAERPEIVVLDLGLPDMPGVQVCREIRRWATMPILVLSARHAEDEKILLLNAGGRIFSSVLRSCVGVGPRLPRPRR